MPVVSPPAGSAIVNTATSGVAYVAPGGTLDADTGTAWSLVNGGAGWTLVSGGPPPAINPVCPPWHLRDLPPGVRPR